jgi:curved DNA-binding protein CbpA
MKKHHPDRAGSDVRLAAVFHERAKTINQAFSVLRDPERRWEYDRQRNRLGWGIPSEEPRHQPSYQRTAASDTPPRTPRQPTWDSFDSILLDPSPAFSLPSLITEAYFPLPGVYEWERGGAQELATILILPVVEVSGFCLATGRLAPPIGQTLNATLLAWGLLALVSLPLLSRCHGC